MLKKSLTTLFFTRTTFFFNCTIACIALLLFAGAIASAQTIRTRQNGNWSDPNTWRGGSVPGNGDDVSIRHTVTMTSNGSVDNVSITTSGELRSNGSTACTLTVRGEFDVLGDFYPGSEISIVVNGSGSGVDLNAQEFYNLTIDGNYEFRRSTTISGVLTVQSGAYLSSSSTSYTIELEAGGACVVNNGTLNLNCTVEYNANAGQYIARGSYRNLDLYGSNSAKTLTGDIEVGNTLTVGSGVEFRGGSGTIELEGTGTPFVVNGTFVPQSSRVNYNAGGNQKVAIVPYYDLYTDGSGVKSVYGSLVVYGDLILSTEMDAGSNTLSVQGDFHSTGQGHVSGSAPTIRFFGTGLSTIVPHQLTMWDIYNMIVEKNSVNDTVMVLLVAYNQTHLALGIDYRGSIAVNSGVLDMGDVYFYKPSGGNPTGTFTLANGAIFRTSFSESMPYFAGWNGTNPQDFASYFIGAASTWELYGANQSIRGAAHGIGAYGNLVLEGTATKSLLSNIVIQNSLTRTSPTLFSRNNHIVSYSPTAVLRYKLSGVPTGGYQASQVSGEEFPSSLGPGSLLIENRMGVYLSASRYIPSALSLVSGRLILGASSLTLGTFANVQQTGATEYVVTDGTGTLGKEGVGPVSFTFPIGPDTSTYNPITILNTGIADLFTARVQPWLQYVPNDTSRVVNVQWVVDEQTPGGSNLSLAVAWAGSQHASQFNPAGTVLLARYQGGGWNDLYNAAVYGGGPYTAAVNGVQAVSAFHISNDTFLPVELTAFTADVVHHKVRLRWSTASELNNAGFELLRRTRGGDWCEIGFVPGYGTTAEAQHYDYVDDLKQLSLVEEFYEYRLRQVDIDGITSDSKTLEVHIPGTPDVCSVFPNPCRVDPQLQVTLYSPGRVSVAVYNAGGVLQQTLVVDRYLDAGTSYFQIPTRALGAGVYFCRVTTPTGMQVRKFTIRD